MSPWPPSNEGGDVLDRDRELVRDEVAEARGIQHAGHAHHLPVRQAAGLPQHIDHRVQRVGDADDEGARRVIADARADLAHDLGIDREQVVAAHAGLAWHAGGDDHHVGAFDRRVVLGAAEGRIEALHRAALGEVERLALGHAFDDVEEHDVAKILERGEVGERAADIARADQRDLAACHGDFLQLSGGAGGVSGGRPSSS